MISEIEEYFGQTFPRYFGNKLEDLYKSRDTLQKGFCHHFISFERQMDQLYREHIPRTDYLKVVKEKVCQFYACKFEAVQTYQKTQLEIRICLLIFCLWLEQAFKETSKKETHKIVKIPDFQKTINGFKLVCQLHSEWSFDTFFEQLFLELGQRKNRMRKIIIEVFQQCGIQCNGFFNNWQTPKKCVTVKKEYIPEIQNLRTPAQVIIKKEVTFEQTLKIKRQDFSPRNSGKSQTNSTNSPWQKTIPSMSSKKSSPSGRTIYMAHPMKYIKKNRKDVRKVYHYVEEIQQTPKQLHF